MSAHRPLLTSRAMAGLSVSGRRSFLGSVLSAWGDQSNWTIPLSTSSRSPLRPPPRDVSGIGCGNLFAGGRLCAVQSFPIGLALPRGSISARLSQEDAIACLSDFAKNSRRIGAETQHRDVDRYRIGWS